MSENSAQFEGSSGLCGAGKQALLASLVALLVACGDSGVAASRSDLPPSAEAPSGGNTAGKACETVRYAWQGEASPVFREATLDRGEWIYTNGLWQAQGANSDSLNRTDYYAPVADDPTHIKRDLYLAMTYDFFGSHRAAHNGDHQLPQDTATRPDGTADLAEVRLAADAQALHVRFLWNSMPRPDAQIATLTFASGSAGTATAWPRNAGLTSRWQQALTVWGTGASVKAADGSETAVPVAVGDHITEACIPLPLLPTSPWTLSGGAGLNDPDSSGQYWNVPAGLASQTAPGSGGPTAASNVWALLFAADTPWSFDELSQSAQLSSGATSSTETVSLADLQQGLSRPAPLRTGNLSRLFVSKLFQADGITRDRTGVAPEGPPAGFTPPIPTPDFNVTYNYTGRLQYYAMHVSEAYAKSSQAYPLIVYLHGYTGLPEEPFYNPVGLVEMADAQGYLLASALGRGDYYYRGEGDFDVLEVIADVQKHYRIDPDRIYLMGHSMGGYGTNNVGAHHPDLFAAMAPAEGTDSTGLHANLRNLPWFMMTADEDLDTGARNALAHYASLSADGYDATLLEYRLKTHEYSSIYDTLPRLFEFFASHRRNPNPAVVSYTRLSSEDRPDLGLIYDGAYWLSGVRASNETTAATLTLESGGIAHVAPDATQVTTIDMAVDEGGPTGRTMAQLKQTIPATAPLLSPANTLKLTAANTGAARMALARAQLSLTTSPLIINSTVDTGLALQLAGTGFNAAMVTVDGGTPVRVAALNGSVSVAVPSGSHQLKVMSAP